MPARPGSPNTKAANEAHWATWRVSAFRIPSIFPPGRAARDTASPEADAALAELCRTYWYPLYAFVRRKGHGPHDAQDLTQAFFARLLEKNYVAQADRERGRFRTYLLAALTHFLADEWDKTRRLKRGGGRENISFDAVSAEERYRLEPIDQLDAAKLYERRWVTTLFDKVLARLEQGISRFGGERTAEGSRNIFIFFERFWKKLRMYY